MIRKRKDKEPLEFYILLIGVLGGVLFHMMWEAKSQQNTDPLLLAVLL